MKSWKKRACGLLLAVSMTTSQMPVQLVYAEEGSVGNQGTEQVATAEVSAISHIVEHMQSVLTTCGITVGMTDEQIANAFVNISDDTIPAKMQEIETECQSVTEADANYLTEEERSIIETYVHFLNVYEKMLQPGLAKQYDDVANGVSVNVVKAKSEQLTDGKLTITAQSTKVIWWSTYTSTVKVQNASGSAGTISFDWSAESVNQLKIDGKAYTGANGTFSKQVDAETEISVEITSGSNSTTNKLVLSNFKFEQASTTSKTTFVYDENRGSVKVDGNVVVNGENKEISFDTGATLTAEAKEGYQFLGWIDENHTILSKDTNMTIRPVKETTVQAVFTGAQQEAWFEVSNSLYSDLNQAAQKGGTVVLAADGVLTAGEYTIPSGTTLLIPFDDANTLYKAEPKYESKSWSKPTAYRTLKMAEGANLTVQGEVSLSAKFSIAESPDTYTGAPTGNVSFIDMDANSNIIVKNGGSLYVWGYITGNGAVTAESGANIYENFQFTDFRGGTQSTQMKDGVFPISQYYIQNVEVPMTLYAGAKETSYTGVYMLKLNFPSSVNFLGNSDCMFNLSSGYITKRYDGASDRLVLDVNGDMSIVGLKLNVGYTTINSSDYNLPINNNISINVKNGSTITLGQNIAMLPGANISVESGATCKLANGVNVFVYDKDEWGGYCGSKNKTFIPVQYAPGKTYDRQAADLIDATLKIDGTLDASQGYLYTTKSGANICGSGKAIINPGTLSVTHQLVQDTGNTQIPITSAKLKNANGDYVETAANGLKTYVVKDGKWIENCEHQEVVDKAVAPTCTETGLTEGKHCSLCNAVIVKQEVVKALGHDLTDVSAKEATCTEAGHEAGKKCSRCDYTEGLKEIKAKGHKEVTDKAVKATCTETGLTEGKHCTTCNTVTVKQEVVKALGHDLQANVEKAATCTETGLSGGSHCSRCDYSEGATILPALGHAEVTDKAVAATCKETGLTEGKHCSRCNSVIVKQEVVKALGHDLKDEEKKDATCTEDGHEAGKKCSRCDYTEGMKKIEALDHDLKDVKKKDATCTEDGHEAGKKCSRCDYTEGLKKIKAKGHTEVTDKAVEATCTETGLTAGTHCSVCGKTLVKQEEVPALKHDWNDSEPSYVWPTEKTEGTITIKCKNKGCKETKENTIPIETIKDYESFVENLQILEVLAGEYVKENPGKDPLELVVKYIRTGVDRYNSGSWGIMAGYEDSGFEKYVRSMEQEAYKQATDESEKIHVTGLKNIETFTLANGNTVDFGHMFGTMDITYTNKQSVDHADVAGWAGDLVDLLSLADRHGVTGTLNEMIEDISSNYLCKEFDESDTFNQQDMYGDLDAYYIMNTISQGKYTSGSLVTIISGYFVESLSDENRADYMIRNRFNGLSTQSAIRKAVYEEYLNNKVVSTLEGTREFTSDSLNELRKASCYAFADYLCKLSGDYVEVTENTYYSVYSSKTSTLAPGITQEIKKATTVDNQNMNYFIATADITRDDVQVIANYNANDPSQGWQMSRVMDQANATQEKYGNPESEFYIPNYNIITGINASGFNMSTGQPSGLFVMNGVEYQPVDGNGFFAILNDGKAVIGTQSDYAQYKDQIKEAVAGFGCTLIKDGKVAINRTEDYFTDRANRTAVGITRTGKVVFMVLDGRQAASGGGSMEEIAQIMLEAGCVDAINLDGGGSTTYIAKQEGATELSLVNSPSDGYARSVANTLMMVSTAPSSTAFDHALINSTTEYMAKGSSQQMTAVGISATGNEAELPEDTTWSVSDSRFATIDENGVLTAVRDYGSVEVQLKSGENVIGKKTITLCVPDKVTFAKSKLDAIYGGKVELPVKAYYEGNEVTITSSDIEFTMDSQNAAQVDGFSLTVKEDASVKVLRVTASLVSNKAVNGSISISLFQEGEANFDFEKATGGDRQLAWKRVVSNAKTEDDIIYMVEDTEADMVTSYTFALDMTQIPIPKQLEDLTYMLPGADMEGASAWTFLLQLAERVSTLTEVEASITFDDKFDVDYSDLTILNEYFTLKETDFDEKTNTLVLTLGWCDQESAIDLATANPLCMLSGLKLTPKKDVDWGTNHRINAVTNGSISYEIYLRASALYSFAQKEENQKIYGLYPFVNPNDESEKGGYFGTTFKEFTDTYTLVNGVNDGWVSEAGGFAYYQDGKRLTGVRKIEGYYYDFGEDGINAGQTKLTGIFYDDTVKAYRYAKFGELVGGWHEIDGKYHYFKSYSKVAATGEYRIDGVTYQFDEKGMTKGAWHTTTEGTRYYYGGTYYVAQNPGYMKLVEIDGKTYNFDNNGYLTYGVQLLRASTAYEKYVYEFGTDGAMVRKISEQGIISVDGNFYYINEQGFVPMNAGLISVGDAYYYVCSSGKLKQNGNQTITTEHVKNYPEITAGVYYFGSDCKMVLPEKPEVPEEPEKPVVPEEPEKPVEPEVKTGIYQEGDIKVYYINGVKQTNLGLIKIDDAYYYVCYSGKLKQNGNQTITAEHVKNYPEITAGVYYFGSDCKMVLPEKPEVPEEPEKPVVPEEPEKPVEPEVKTGIYQEGDIKVYYVNGVKQTNLGLIKIDDAYYYVCYSGKLKQNGNQTITAEHVKNYPEITAGVYYFGSDCKMVKK